ncbi:L-type lectin-domain containing receptor kinase V.9-like [Coffea eugenioides]|nr:L-type lectin-domain containing receptor kinase V.9-like [Coffea eugenioides]
MSSALQLLLLLASLAASINGQEFIFHSSLRLDGVTEIMPDGSAVQVNSTGLVKGQVFYAQPLKIRPSQTSNSIFSFSTTFVFSMRIEDQLAEISEEGLSFIMSSSKWLPLYSLVPEGGDRKLEDSSSLISINFKASQDWMGIENNHLEVTINGAPVVKHSPLGFYRKSSDELWRVRITKSGQMSQVWLDYDGMKREISVTVAPVSSSAPERHSFSYPLDIEPYFSDDIFVGLSTSKLVKPLASKHYLLGWSMKVNGKAQNLDLDEMIENNQNEVFGITPGIEEFQRFTCFSCLEKYLSRMNCTTEQIEVLEGQCMMINHGIM